MKIQVKNLGPLKEAEFEVADLTIICGGNNTGKTYATYALFGFLHAWERMIDITIDSSIMESIGSEGNATINLKKYIEQSENIINSAYQKYSVTLSDFSSTSSQVLQDDKFKADFNINMNDNMDKIKCSTFKVVFRMASGPEALYIIKKPNDFNLTITLLSEPLNGNFYTDPVSCISGIIKATLFTWLIPYAFIASVERTGISIFRKEIDVSRNNLLGNMFTANTPDEKLKIFTEKYQRYPLPIQFGLDFNRSIGRGYKNLGFIEEHHPSILEDFADTIGGKYSFNEHDELYYSPESNLEIKLSMYESSSAVRSLLDLGFYLRNIAHPGSLLIIDEPELNLHPENQRKIARLLARLVNIGIKVFITTHSDYIIKELNTLIMLNHDKPHLKKIAEEEGYKPEELIAAERIKVYIAENSTLVPANIDPEMGIEARSFDTTIEDMNRIQEAIVWGEE